MLVAELSVGAVVSADPMFGVGVGALGTGELVVGVPQAVRRHAIAHAAATRRGVTRAPSLGS